MAQISDLRSGSGKAKDMEYEQRAEALNSLFLDKMAPLLTEINKEAVDAEAEAQLLYW